MWFANDKKEYDVIDVEVTEENIDNSKKEEKKENNKSKTYNKKSPFEEGMKEFEDAMNQIGDSISKGIEKAKVWVSGSLKKGNSITNKLVKILPFMDEKDIHEIVEKILNDDPEFKGVDVSAIMPFLSQEDCDKVFMKKLKEDDEIALEIIHFVSESSLSLLVDAYIEGKYPDLDVDKLYPFLNKEDVKKLFYYELRKNKK
jgi:hypothetical protein